VIWLLAGAGAVGLLLGLRFRIPSILAASTVILAGGLVAVPVTGLWTALAGAFGALCALQGGYVMGLLLWCAAARVRWPLGLAQRESTAEDHVRATRTSAAGGG
jgi:hypothetical protein